MENDVRTFSIAGDHKIFIKYQQDSSMISSEINTLTAHLHALNLNQKNRLSTADRSIIHQWQRDVANPVIVNQHRNSIRFPKSSDNSLHMQITKEDQRLGELLNEAASVAEERRQRLLHHLLIASSLLVTIVTVVALTLLEARSAAMRRVLKQTLLYEQERKVAMRLQQELLPDQLPIVSALALHSIYVPASLERHIGGDWYDAIKLQGNRMLFMIGDVAGHGLDAALIMSRVRQQIISAAFSEDDPAMILKRTNAMVAAKISRLVTAACCILELDTHRMIYATAGHPAPIIVPVTGSAFVLPNGAPPLGVLDELEIVSFEHIFDAGSMMVLYIDVGGAIRWTQFGRVKVNPPARPALAPPWRSPVGAASFDSFDRLASPHGSNARSGRAALRPSYPHRRSRPIVKRLCCS